MGQAILGGSVTEHSTVTGTIPQVCVCEYRGRGNEVAPGTEGKGKRRRPPAEYYNKKATIILCQVK